MDSLYLVGRILFSTVFLVAGLGHLKNLGATSEAAASKGTPAPKAAVALSGLMILAGGASVLLGVWMEIGAWLLVFFLLPVSFVMHAFWRVDDPEARQTERAHFMKNLALAGAALMLYWGVQSVGYGPLTLGSPLG